MASPRNVDVLCLNIYDSDFFIQHDSYLGLLLAYKTTPMPLTPPLRLDHVSRPKHTCFLIDLPISAYFKWQPCL